MPSYTSISSEKLARLIGTAKAPTLIDVRLDEDFAADPRPIPGPMRHSFGCVWRFCVLTDMQVSDIKSIAEGDSRQGDQEWQESPPRRRQQQLDQRAKPAMEDHLPVAAGLTKRRSRAS